MQLQKPTHTHKKNHTIMFVSWRDAKGGSNVFLECVTLLRTFSQEKFLETQSLGTGLWVERAALKS